MPGLDNLLAKSLDNVIRANLSETTLQKVENRLFEKYGINLTQSFNEFHKLDSVLKEFFGGGAEGLERKILENICTLKQIKNTEASWMTIEDILLTKIILESFGDEDKKKILTTLTEEPRIVSEILDIYKLPQTSGYRKINALIDDGMVMTNGYVTTSDGKRVNKYISVFENVKIDIVKNKVTVKVQLSDQSMKDSLMIPLIQGR